MKKRIGRLGLVVGATVAALSAAAAPAHAFVPQAPTFVHCDRILIDPPSFATITFYGTIGGVNIGLPATHIPNTVFSEADISALTTGTGDIPYTVIPYWSVPANPYGVTSGYGPVTKGVLRCHEPPTTTTTSPATTSTTIDTTGDTLPPSPPDRAVPVIPTPPTTAGTPHQLPNTGSSPITVPLTIFGGACVLGGGALLLKGRRRYTRRGDYS